MRPSAEEVSNAIAKAVTDLVYNQPSGHTSIGPIRVGAGLNEADDWWGFDAPRAKRRTNNPAVTVWVNREAVATVIASPSGKKVLVVLPEGTDVEWITTDG